MIFCFIFSFSLYSVEFDRQYVMSSAYATFMENFPTASSAAPSTPDIFPDKCSAHDILGKQNYEVSSQ